MLCFRAVANPIAAKPHSPPIHLAFKRRVHNRSVRRMHLMFRKLVLSLAAAAGMVAQLVLPAEAGIGVGAFAAGVSDDARDAGEAHA